MLLSSTLYPGGVLWEAEWRWPPSFAAVDVLSLALDLFPGFPPPSWLSTSDVFPEELSCREIEEEGGRVNDKWRQSIVKQCVSMQTSVKICRGKSLMWDVESCMLA